MGKRTIAGVLKWATAIVVGITAFAGAVIGLGEQIVRFRVAVFGNEAVDNAKDGWNTVFVDDIPPPDNVLQPVETPTPEPIVSPTGNPNDYSIGNEIYKREPVIFTVKPPEATKELIMKLPCSCVQRHDYVQKIEVMNTCAADAKLVVMKYPHYPAERFQPLPVKEGRELNSDTTYAAITLPPKRYIRITYPFISLVDLQVTQCSTE